MAATETKSQITCPIAADGSSLVRRVTNEMPMPESTNTMGRIAGSAPGARKRTAMWATTKATMREMGTASVCAVS